MHGKPSHTYSEAWHALVAPRLAPSSHRRNCRSVIMSDYMAMVADRINCDAVWRDSRGFDYVQDSLSGHMVQPLTIGPGFLPMLQHAEDPEDPPVDKIDQPFVGALYVRELATVCTRYIVVFEVD